MLYSMSYLYLSLPICSPEDEQLSCLHIVLQTIQIQMFLYIYAPYAHVQNFPGHITMEYNCWVLGYVHLQLD